MGNLAKKVIMISGALAVSSSFVAAPVSAETTLKFANWLPPVHHWTSTARKFSDSIEAASGGKIKVTIDKGALAKPRTASLQSPIKAMTTPAQKDAND